MKLDLSKADKSNFWDWSRQKTISIFDSIHFRKKCVIKMLSLLHWSFRNLKTSKNIINFEINLVGLYHKSTFELFPQHRLTHFVISIQWLVRTVNRCSPGMRVGSLPLTCTNDLFPDVKTVAFVIWQMEQPLTCGGCKIKDLNIIVQD